MVDASIQATIVAHQRKDRLRFLTCGSVDDGKSTLIGRLLLDSQAVLHDQLLALKKDSERHGTAGRGVTDPALLLDGLEAEREQGITIDVAYRYFSTKKRKFIIADTPGHEQYTRNMVTGASTANLAILLVDARKGVLTQTRRHAAIASLLGLRHVVLAVNKMDLVDWSEASYLAICQDFAAFAARLQIPDIKCIPMSALLGDNVVGSSAAAPWYTGGPLLSHLETVQVGGDAPLVDLRVAVAGVVRPSLDFRGILGTMLGGTLAPGDEVVVLPSGTRTRVDSVLTPPGAREAFSPMAVTLTLRDEVDVSRGAMLVSPTALPHKERSFEAVLVWMDAEGLRPGSTYLLKHTTQTMRATVERVVWKFDIASMQHVDTETLGMNEIGRVEVTTAHALFWDAYAKNRNTGSFILIDRISNQTVGAGMILETTDDATESAERIALVEKMSAQNAAQKTVRPEDRRALLGHKGGVVWITGLPRSGKSTLAYRLERDLVSRGVLASVLDGVEMRLGLCRDLGFSPDDRSENGRRSMEVAKLLADAGIVVLAAFVSPFAEDRALAKNTIGRDRFIEVFMGASADVCRARDTFGLYASRRTGPSKRFMGIHDAYEAPTAADLVIDADATPEQAADAVMKVLSARGWIEDGGF